MMMMMMVMVMLLLLLMMMMVMVMMMMIIIMMMMIRNFYPYVCTCNNQYWQHCDGEMIKQQKKTSTRNK